MDLLQIDTRLDEDVLLPTEAEIRTSIGTYIVKEWTYAAFKPIKSHVLEFFQELMDKKLEPTLIFFRPAAAAYFEEIMIYQLDGLQPDISPERVAVLIERYEAEEAALREISMVALDYAVPVIAHTTGEKAEKVEEMSVQEMVALFFTILDLNGGYLKNSLGLFGKAYRNVQTPDEPKQEDQKTEE